MDEPRAANVVAETDTTCMALDREVRIDSIITFISLPKKTKMLLLLLLSKYNNNIHPLFFFFLLLKAFNELLGPLRDILDHELSLRVLKSVPILRCLNDEERLTIAKAMTSHTFADGEYIISQVSFCCFHSFFLLNSVTPQKKNKKGGEES